MKSFGSHIVGVDQGEEMLFADYETGGAMWTGTGARARRKAVKFSQRFRRTPVVHVSITMWDTDCGTNARMDLAAERVTPEGFDLVFRTWSDTRIAQVRLAWMAIGEVAHEDDWDLY